MPENSRLLDDCDVIKRSRRCTRCTTSVWVRRYPVRDPRLHRLLAGPGDLTAGRRAGLPVRRRPAASRQPDRVEERHPLRRDQDRPRQAHEARFLSVYFNTNLVGTLRSPGNRVELGPDLGLAACSNCSVVRVPTFPNTRSIRQVGGSVRQPQDALQPLMPEQFLHPLLPPSRPWVARTTSTAFRPSSRSSSRSTRRA